MTPEETEHLISKLNNSRDLSDVYGDIVWLMNMKTGFQPIVVNYTSYQVFRLLVFKFLNNRQFTPTAPNKDYEYPTLPLKWRDEANTNDCLYFSEVYHLYSDISWRKSDVNARGENEVSFTFRMLLGNQEVSRTFQETEIPLFALEEGKISNLDWIKCARMFDSLTNTFSSRWEEVASTGKLKKNSFCGTPIEKINLNATFPGQFSIPVQIFAVQNVEEQSPGYGNQLNFDNQNLPEIGALDNNGVPFVNPVDDQLLNPAQLPILQDENLFSHQ